MRLRPHGTDSGALSRSRNRQVNPLDAPPHPQKSFYLTPISPPMQYQAIILAFRCLLASICRGAAGRPRWFHTELVGPWPMWGGNRGQAHTRQAQQQQPARMAAFGRVGFSGSVSDLNSKRGKSTCLKRARDFRACLPPPFLTLGGSLNLQPTLPPGAGRGSGPAHQHKLWAGALCSWPSRADARV